MANYYDGCVRKVTSPEGVGLGFGDDGDEEETLICICLRGTPINPELGEEWHRQNWSSLTIPAARELYLLLDSVKHHWAPVVCGPGTGACLHEGRACGVEGAGQCAAAGASLMPASESVLLWSGRLHDPNVDSEAPVQGE